MNKLRGDDRGQITTALVIVGTVVVVALAMLATKLGQATDQKSQIQIAADSSALAAAQQIHQDGPGKIEDAIRDGGGGRSGSGQGQDAATDFATRGGARLVQYSYDQRSGTAHVWVESLTNSVSGSPAKAEAAARVGLSFDDCAVSPPSQPTPTPTPAKPDSDPPDVNGEMRCGEVTIPIVFDGASGEIRSRLSHSEIRGLFDHSAPALTS